AYGIKRAKEHSINVLAMDKLLYRIPEFADKKILEFVQYNNTDYIVMAGYMRKVTSILLDAFPNKILNIHPALLPSFKGAHPIEDAWDAGVKITGVTVHFANAEYDNGPIIAQRTVPVLQDDTLDTLEARIHECEYELYLEVLHLLIKNRIKIIGNRVFVEE
ncbi:MAG: phosphoribosylglycinamide formyltransferase, partial [Eggerthellaceae bacterium]|nr:phosphoribosylglycinamide formyltransferase [Eggerthellaceae bacterium]